MSTANHPESLSDETIAAFIDGRLAEPERTKVMEHINGCDECRFVYSVASDAMAGEAAVVAPNVIQGQFGRSRRTYAVIAAVAAAIALAFGLAPARQWWGDRQAGIPAIARAANRLDVREVEARLSGFEHKKLKPVMRGDKESADYRIDTLRAMAVERAAENPTADNLHASGVALLISGESTEGLEHLERALKTETGKASAREAIQLSKDADLLVTLSAAYLAAAKNRENAEREYDAALEAAEKARQLDPQSGPAAFNHALALQQYPAMRNRAIQAWRAYLEIDKDAGWREEAERALAELERPTAEQRWKAVEPVIDAAARAGDVDAVGRHLPEFATTLRSRAQATLFPLWARQAAANDPAAASTLTAVRTMGAALARSTGDLLLRDSVTAIDQASPTNQVALIRAHALVDEAVRDRARERELLQAARELFTAAGSPYRHVVQYRIAAGLMGRTQQIEACLEELAHPAATVDPRYRITSAQFSGLRGLVCLAQGKHGESMVEYRAMLSAVETSGEPYWVASVHRLIAENRELAGDEEGAAAHRWRAMVIAARTASPTEVMRTFSSWSRAASKATPLAARLFLDELLEADRKTSDASRASRIAYALLWHAVANARIGDSDGVSRDLERMKTVLSSMRAEDQERAAANIDFARAVYLPGPDQHEAIDQALAYADRTKTHFRRARLLLERGRLFAERGDRPRAIADFIAGLETVALQVESARGDEMMRDSLLETHGDLFDALIEAELADGRANEAFSHGFMRRTGMRTGPATSIPSRLGAGTVLVEFIVLPRRLVMRLSEDGRPPAFHEAAIAREELRESVGQLLAAVKAGTDCGPFLDQLAERLIAPMESRLAGATKLLIAADPPVSMVPFAALRVGLDRRYLIERSTIALWSGEEGRTRTESSKRSALLVANPLLPPREQGGFPPLRGAEREVDAVRPMYATSTVLARADATAASFLREAQRYSVIQLSLHALLNDRDPLGSELLFCGDRAPSVQGVSVLEISRLSLSNVEIVVLSGCETGRDVVSRRYPLAIASGFLRAGAATVVAALVDIEDESSSPILIDFHRALAAGAEPAVALREAQRAHLKIDRSPSSLKMWAPFHAITSRI